MEDYKRKLVNVYNHFSEPMAEKFRSIGTRVEDIERAFGLVGKKLPKVVEVGCGDGRDAKEIIPRASDYIGLDISLGMLKLAREYNPTGRFIEGDISTFEIPDDTDIVFGFASLLHLPKNELASFLKRAHDHLSDDGLIYLSLKTSDSYKKELKRDEFGERLFFYYSLPDIDEMSADGYARVYDDTQLIGTTEWLTVALRKK